MKICQRRAFDGIIMIGAVQCDHSFFSGIGVNDELVVTRRNYFVFFREQEDRWSVTRFRIFDAVEISRDLQRDWTS